LQPLDIEIKDHEEFTIDSLAFEGLEISTTSQIHFNKTASAQTDKPTVKVTTQIVVKTIELIDQVALAVESLDDFMMNGLLDIDMYIDDQDIIWDARCRMALEIDTFDMAFENPQEPENLTSKILQKSDDRLS
jgi:hypothetical protein